MKQITESLRQQKVAALIQKDVSEIFIKEVAELVSGALVTVTKVRVSPDLSVAKVYLSVFPFDKHELIVKNIKAAATQIRFLLGKRVKNQLRIVPELAFFNDDSMEYVERIEELIKK